MIRDNKTFADTIKSEEEKIYEDLYGVGDIKKHDDSLGKCEMCGRSVNANQSRRTITEIVFSGNTVKTDVKFYHIGGCFDSASVS